MEREKPYALKWKLNGEAAKKHGLLHFDWDSLPAEREKYLLKEGPDGDILYLPPDGDRSGIIVKVFLNNSSYERFLDFVRPSKASREYFFAKMLPKKGVPSATPLGYSLLRGSMFPQGSVFASLELPSRQTLSKLLQDSPDPKLRKSALQRYGSMLGKLNRVSLYIKDFHLDNVIVETSPERDPVYWVIDHESSWPGLAWLESFRLKNLCSALYADGDLEITKDEQKDILRSYLQQLYKATPDAEEVEELLQDVEEYQTNDPTIPSAQQSKDPYRGPEQRGKVHIYRHHQLRADDLASAFDDLCHGKPVEALTFKNKKVRTEPELLPKGSLLERIKMLFGSGKGRKLMEQERLKRSSSDRALIAYVEKRPFGPSALFWVRTHSKAKKKKGGKKLPSSAAHKRPQKQLPNHADRSP